MVQILRDQPRNYVADKSSAINAQQTAQSISDWGNLFRGVGNLVGSAEADRKAAHKQNVEADQRMIDTQIGRTAQTELMSWYSKQIESGVDPASEDFTNKLIARRKEIYEPLIEQMGTQEGKDFLAKQGLDTQERLRQSSIGKVSRLRNAALAQKAYGDAAKDLQNDAYEFGKIGDLQGYKKAAEPTKKELLNYAKKKGGEEAKAATELALDEQAFKYYTLGLAQSDPETIITMADDQDSLREIVYKKLEKEYPNMSQKEKEQIYQKAYKDTGQKESADEQLLDLLTENQKERYTNNIVNNADALMRDYKGKLKTVDPKSSAAQQINEEINKLQAVKDDPESAMLDSAREMLRTVALPAARKQMQLNALAEKEREKEFELHNYTMLFSPDPVDSSEAKLYFTNRKQDTTKESLEKLFNMSFPDNTMQSSIDDFIEADNQVSMQEKIDWVGTDAMWEAAHAAASANPNNPIEFFKAAMDGYVAMNKAPVTQEQKEIYKSMMNTMAQNKAYKDIYDYAFNNKDRFYPDTTWFENAFGRITAPMSRPGGMSALISDPTNIDYFNYSEEERDALSEYDEAMANTPRGEQLDRMGLVAERVGWQDKDKAKAYLDTHTLALTNEMFMNLWAAAQQPDKTQQTAMAQAAIDNWMKGKREVLDYVMQNFGIDLAKLREVYNTKGEAITQIGTKYVAYKGDDPSTGLPKWEDYYDEKETKKARETIIEASKII